MWALLLSKLTGLITQSITGINFTTVLAGAQKYVGVVFANIKAHWRFYLPIALAGCTAITGYGWSHEHTALLKERAAHQQDIATFKRTQAEADAKAQTTRTILQKESKANADEADAKYTTLLAEYRANLMRYKAYQSGTSQSNHYQLPPTQGGNGPGASTEVLTGSIVISGDDAQICAVNTARLQAVHDWALNPPKDGM